MSFLLELAGIGATDASANAPERAQRDPGAFTPAMQARRQKVIAMLAAAPEKERAYHVDPDADPEHLVVTVAIRGECTFDVLVPKSRATVFDVMDVLGRLPC